MLLTSNWRLDILFIVSGVAISFMISKMSLRDFAWQRMLKLLIPLIFAVTVVVAPQSYYEALQKGVFEGSFRQFWTTQYFSFTWDERMIAPFPTFNHMWYVAYLFIYTILLLPLFAFINSKKGAAFLAQLESWLTKGSRIIWLPLALYILILFVNGDDNITHAFIDDWYGHSIYIFALVMGLLFVRMPSLWAAFERNRYLSLVIGLVGYTPKHASWLNQIEIWFSILMRKLLRRPSFTSQNDLKKRIETFIAYFNETMAKPFKWTMTGKPLSILIGLTQD